MKFAALTVTAIPVQANTESGLLPASGSACIANIRLIDNPYVTRRLFLIQPDKHGIAYVPMFNYTPYDIEIQWNEFVAVIKNMKGCTYEEVNPAYINSLSIKHEEADQGEVLRQSTRRPETALSGHAFKVT